MTFASNSSAPFSPRPRPCLWSIRLGRVRRNKVNDVSAVAPPHTRQGHLVPREHDLCFSAASVLYHEANVVFTPW